MLLSPALDALLAGVLGLLVGSFLNVVIYRTPLLMAREWWDEARNLLLDADAHKQVFGVEAPAELKSQAERLSKDVDQLPPFSLARPRSRCRQCGHQIRWYENIPVFSWLALRGKCSSCGTPIGARYPLVEIATGLLFAWCGWKFGLTPRGAAWAFFAACIVALALIDWDTTFLPDAITLPLVWAGLIASALGWTAIPLVQSLWGAVAGYLSLWTVYQGFKLLTGKEGMGFGDFKLFAALGAWFGWQALVPVILLASIVGAVIGILLKMTSGLRQGGYVPFGPFLAGAGLLVMFFGASGVMGAIGL